MRCVLQILPLFQLIFSGIADLGIIDARLVSNITRLRRSSNSGITCTLPPHPKNGLWILQNGIAREGEQIKVNSILVFECRKGYKLSQKSPYVICDRKWDISKMPQCLKLCPPISSTSTTMVKCLSKSGAEIGCDEATHGSYMSYNCAPFYEAPVGYQTTSYCVDGDWNSPPPLCQPICGKKVHDDTTPLVYGGKEEEVIEYPWIAVIYRYEGDQFTNICGGSIINQKLVLTAAHCVTNPYGDTLSPEIYRVGAGKLFNKYNDPRDPSPQYLEVSDIVSHPKYKGDSRRYQADIAVIVTKGRFTLNKFVQPVCFNGVNKINLQVGSLGVVGGFGISEGGLPSDQLRTLDIPYKSEATCARELPGDWGDRFNVIDKLCAGFYNKSMGICRGDSGNGLFFKNSDNNRYYVHALVSLGHAIKHECNFQTNALYTKVAYHYDFVDRELTKYYIKDCTLPPHPENGQWTIHNLEKKPGDTVPSSTVLEISCKDGYKLSSDVTHFTCESSFVMPTCQRLCPPPNLSALIQASCSTMGGEEIHCNEAVENSILTYQCPSDYQIPKGTKNTRKCLNGVWETPAITCLNVDDGTAPVEGDDDDDSSKVVCMYDQNQYENGVKPEDFNATLCNYVIFNSLTVAHDGNLRVKRADSDKYRSVSDMKKRNRKLKVLLSVYGSGKSPQDEYPTLAADPIKRNTFVSTVSDFIDTYNFDGLNVHWDVPQKEDKYADLLSEVKAAFEPQKWILTATVYFAPTYLGYSRSLGQLVKWINVESYKFYDEWAKYTGQNAALYHSSVETPVEVDYNNVLSSVKFWDNYGIKENQISIGVAFFGRYYTLQNPRKHGLHAPITKSTDANHTGLVSYAEICDNYKNWTRVWDDEQKTPYKYYQNKWVGYDDEESVRHKGAFAEKFGYFGVTVNSIDKDDVHGRCGPKQNLLKHVHEGLGTGLV